MGVKLLASSGGSVELVPTNTASNFTVTVPAATTTMVGTDATQTLTNKTSTTIGVGNATPASSGSGITFPAAINASSDANTLDDYEEGTWTPTVTSGTGSITSYTSAGYYTKVGNVVNITCSFTIVTAGTAASTASFSLPFTAKTVAFGGGNRACLFLAREDQSTGVNYQGIITSGSTTALLYALNATTGITWTNGYVYVMSFSYLSS